MESIKLYISSNKDWLFPTLGALAALFAWIVKRSLRREPNSVGDVVQRTGDVVVNNNFTGPTTMNQSESWEQPEPAVAHAKERITILFIDDDLSFKIVSMLKKAGWKRVSIVADVDRVDHEKIKAADILFIDVQGVGKKLGFDREGLGLMKAIKMKYPEKKAVIYSGVSSHDIFADEIDHADGRLRKTAEFIQFEQKIEELVS